jgi:tryptophan 7-halogenase
MNANPVKNVVIAGGGTAGWMTAAALSRLMGKGLEIQLIESDEIPSVGVGEATIPPILNFHRLLKIDEQAFMRATSATFKLGINFENWRSRDQQYFHSFGHTGQDCWAATFHNFWLKGLQQGQSADFEAYCLEIQAARQNRFAHHPNTPIHYAYHFDAGRYAQFLRKIAEQEGVRRREGKIDEVILDPDTGFIAGLRLASGELIAGDLFIDCSGMQGLLIEQALNAGYEDWSHWLPCDRAIPLQTAAVSEPVPYTRSIAHEAGWQWRIPLQHRVGNGLVYSSKYLTDDQAADRLLKNVAGEPRTDPRVIRFRTGRRRKQWLKNCVAIGLSSGFLEPLESTSIHLIQRSVIRLLQLFPAQGVKDTDVQEFNRQADRELEYIRDFIILHYKVTQRDDSPFWRYCKAMEVPETLARRIALFQHSGRIFHEDVDLFHENSWAQVMLGQGMVPEQYHHIVDMMSQDELRAFLGGIKAAIDRTVVELPSHQAYLERYCMAVKN